MQRWPAGLADLPRPTRPSSPCLIDHRGDVREVKRGYPDESLPALIDRMNGLLEERAQDLAGVTGP